MTCPLLYRYRSVDKLPEEPSPAAVRGTVVHKVLEDLFDLPAAERTSEQAQTMVVPSWEALLEAEPELEGMFGDDGPEVGAWLAECRGSLEKYFELEDPSRLEPAERELYVETLLDSRLLLRGFVDRVDVAPDGRVRLVDYKSGRSVGERFEGKALFQMKFYALVWWKTRGAIPALLQLIYLGNTEVLSYAPDEADLLATERKVNAVFAAIRNAEMTGDWRPNKSRLCDWCSFQAHCPEFGGEILPLPMFREALAGTGDLGSDLTDD
jgi:putative RecB family exonuclease